MKGRDEGGREIEFCHDGWMGSHVLFQIELDLLPRPDSVPNKEVLHGRRTAQGRHRKARSHDFR